MRCAQRLGLGLGQRGQKHRRQNGDDGNNHEQFDQGEGVGQQISGVLSWVEFHVEMSFNFVKGVKPESAAVTAARRWCTQEHKSDLQGQEA